MHQLFRLTDQENIIS